MIRKIAMLDIDGVLNCERWIKSPGFERPTVQMPGARRLRPGVGKTPTTTEGKPVLIEPAAVQLLNHLVRDDVTWVLSSTWRGDGTGHVLVGKILAQLGWVGELAGSTPVLRADHSRGANATRGDEIAAWLEREGIDQAQIGGEVKLAILDDDHDVDPLAEHLVAVDEREGLTPRNILQAARKLDVPLVMVDELVKPAKKQRVRSCFNKGHARLTISDQRHVDVLREFVRTLKSISPSWAVEDDPERGLHFNLTRGHRYRALGLGALCVPAADQLAEGVGR